MKRILVNSKLYEKCYSYTCFILYNVCTLTYLCVIGHGTVHCTVLGQLHANTSACKQFTCKPSVALAFLKLYICVDKMYLECLSRKLFRSWAKSYSLHFYSAIDTIKVDLYSLKFPYSKIRLSSRFFAHWFRKAQVILLLDR